MICTTDVIQTFLDNGFKVQVKLETNVGISITSQPIDPENFGAAWKIQGAIKAINGLLSPGIASAQEALNEALIRAADDEARKLARAWNNAVSEIQWPCGVYLCPFVQGRRIHIGLSRNPDERTEPVKHTDLLPKGWGQ